MTDWWISWLIDSHYQHCLADKSIPTTFHFAAEDNTEKLKEIERKRHEILETIRTAPFEEIVARSEAKVT